MDNLTLLFYRYFQIVILLFWSNPVASDISTEELDEYEAEVRGIYYSLPNLLTEMNRTKYKKNRSVQELTDIFRSYCYPEIDLEKERKNPFIVIEGTYRNRRQKLGHVISDSVKGVMMNKLPQAISHLRYEFKRPPINSLFFSIAMYIIAYDVAKQLDKTPVIVTGYWMLHAATKLAVEYQLPPHESILYEFPKDLLKPDLVLFFSSGHRDKVIDYDQQEGNTRADEVYRRMRNPSVREFSYPYIRHEHLSRIKDVIRKALAPKYTNFIIL